MQNLAPGSWTWIVLAATIALGLMLAYVEVRTSRITRSETLRSEQGAKRIYEEEDKEGAPRRAPSVGRRTWVLAAGVLLVIIAAFCILTIVEGEPTSEGQSLDAAATPPSAAAPSTP